MHIIERDHEICMAHRLYKHEGKCSQIHGHNYIIKFSFTGECLDNVGRIADFADIKTGICNWLDENWDHRTMLYVGDPLAEKLKVYDPSVIISDHNPTAENMAAMIYYKAWEIYKGTGIRIKEVKVWETQKCMASYSVKYSSRFTDEASNYIKGEANEKDS